MKKTVLSALAIATLTLIITSCGPSKAYTAQKATIEQAITNINAATNLEEFVAANVTYNKLIDSINTVCGTDMAEAEAAEIATLGTQLQTAMEAKMEELDTAQRVAEEAQATTEEKEAEL